jgi:hypothetical protein
LFAAAEVGPIFSSLKSGRDRTVVPKTTWLGSFLVAELVPDDCAGKGKDDCDKGYALQGILDHCESPIVWISISLE